MTLRNAWEKRAYEAEAALAAAEPPRGKVSVLAPPDPRKDLEALEELVAKWRGLRGVDWSAEPDGWKVTFNVCAGELEQRLAEMRGAKR